ncbi:MAG: redoxin domain-containing protein [Planctomycetota bacterium]
MRIRVPLILALLAVLTTPGCDRTPAVTSVQLAGLGGERVKPFEVGDAALRVFIFVRTDCPIANRYAPEIQKLAGEYRPRDVAFSLVYPDPRESAEVIETHLEEHRYVDLSVFRDPDHALVDLAGATITPEAAVYDPSGTLLYRGRIDDRHVDLGRSRPRAGEHDLARALDEALAGTPVTTPRTRAVGCYITGLKKQ